MLNFRKFTTLLVDHDLAEHGTKEPTPTVGDAVRLDVDVPPSDGSRALQV